MYKNAWLKKRAEKLVYGTRRVHRRSVGGDKVETTYTPNTINPTNGEKVKGKGSTTADKNNGASARLNPIGKDVNERRNDGDEDGDGEDSSSEEAEVEPPFKMTEVNIS